MRPLIAYLLLLRIFACNLLLSSRWSQAVGLAALMLAVTNGIDRALAPFTFLGQPYFLTGFATLALCIALVGAAKSDTARSAARSGTSMALWATAVMAVMGLTALSQGVYLLLDRAPVHEQEWHNFQQHVPFGLYDPTMAHYHMLEDLAPPPGDGRIVGRVIHGGKPVPGAELRAVINTLYQTPVLTTAEDGHFEIPVEKGSWGVNFVELLRWPDKPEDGHFVAVTGLEPPAAVPYHRSRFMGDRPPLEIHARDEPLPPHFTIEINPAVRHQWPPAILVEEGVKADPEQAILKWEAHPGASQYAITIERAGIDKDGEITPFYEHAWYGVADAEELPLSRVDIAENKRQTTIYRYRVFAFDDSGRLVSFMPSNSYEQHRFHLVDQEIVGNRLSLYDSDVSLPRVIHVEAQKARAITQLDTVKLLVEHGHFEDASAFLDELDSSYVTRAQIDEVAGYLAAAQGHCSVAEDYFQAALAANPRLCAGDCYRADCAAPGED